MIFFETRQVSSVFRCGTVAAMLCVFTPTIAADPQSKADRKRQKQIVKQCIKRIEFKQESDATPLYTVLGTIDIGPSDDMRDLTDFYFGIDRTRSAKKKACKLGADAILLPPKDATRHPPRTARIVVWTMP